MQQRVTNKKKHLTIINKDGNILEQQSFPKTYAEKEIKKRKKLSWRLSERQRKKLERVNEKVR